MKQRDVLTIAKRFLSWHSGFGTLFDVEKLLGDKEHFITSVLEASSISDANGNPSADVSRQEATLAFTIAISMRFALSQKHETILGR